MRETRVTTFRLYIRTYNICYYYSPFFHVQLVGKFAQLKGRFTVVYELERHRLAVHEYCESDSIRTMRQMTDVYFVDFIELTLKSKDDFSAAFDIILSTNLAEYRDF